MLKKKRTRNLLLKKSVNLRLLWSWILYLFSALVAFQHAHSLSSSYYSCVNNKKNHYGIFLSLKISRFVDIQPRLVIVNNTWRGGILYFSKNILYLLSCSICCCNIETIYERFAAYRNQTKVAAYHHQAGTSCFWLQILFPSAADKRQCFPYIKQAMWVEAFPPMCYAASKSLDIRERNLLCHSRAAPEQTQLRFEPEGIRYRRLSLSVL